jgi:hypothetical protein
MFVENPLAFLGAAPTPPEKPVLILVREVTCLFCADDDLGSFFAAMSIP